jgi:hypothetical protein
MKCLGNPQPSPQLVESHEINEMRRRGKRVNYSGNRKKREGGER